MILDVVLAELSSGRVLCAIHGLPKPQRVDNCREWLLTSRRVIIKVGLISRRTIEMNLERIESIGVDQGIFGRIFGYGTITMIGTGGTKEPWPRCRFDSGWCLQPF
jgi:hypothetical protein